MEGQPSGFTCPECNGVLWETRDGDLFYYRCRVGHSFTHESLHAFQGEALEAALWSALRSLEERVSLARRLAERTRRDGRDKTASYFHERADEAEHHADVIRTALTSIETTGVLPEDQEAARAS